LIPPSSTPRFLSWRAQRSHSKPDTLSVTIERGGPVKVSFFGVPGIPRLRPPHIAPDNGLQIASPLDLAGTKAAVVQRRAEAKAYRDIDALLQDGRMDLPTALTSISTGNNSVTGMACWAVRSTQAN
jgi:hypothetical protein